MKIIKENCKAVIKEYTIFYLDFVFSIFDEDLCL